MDEHNCPIVTIGIPVKDEILCINHVLKSVEDVDYPKKRIKLVIVDGYSTDGTYEILSEWIEKVKNEYIA